MPDTSLVITYAQDYLSRQPFDIVHDLEHHQLVVQNCLNIIAAEKITVNSEVLLTAAWWHDVEKSYATANSSDKTVDFFRQTASSLEMDPEMMEQVSLTIKEHSYSQSQTTLESKILFDADKIEYVNDARIEKLVTDVVENPERYQKNHLQNTHDIWVARIKKVPEMMHFSYSKGVFAEKLAATEDILTTLHRVLKTYKV